MSQEQLPPLPDGWEWDGHAATRPVERLWMEMEAELVASIKKDLVVENASGRKIYAPLSVVAAVLRRAGWRVEEPETKP